MDASRPNGLGLCNVEGNALAWCSDVFTIGNRGVVPTADRNGPCVMRGGSYRCHASYCNRYRVAARSPNTPESSTGNLGFRIAT